MNAGVVSNQHAPEYVTAMNAAYDICKWRHDAGDGFIWGLKVMQMEVAEMILKHLPKKEHSPDEQPHQR